MYNFSKEDNIGKLLRENTRGGADVVIDCVGMDGQVAQDDLEISSNSAQRGNISPIITAAESVVVDNNIVTSRVPDDLDDFNREIIKQLEA